MTAVFILLQHKATVTQRALGSISRAIPLQFFFEVWLHQGIKNVYN